MSTTSAITLATNVLEALPALVTASGGALQLIHSTVGTLKVMQSQGRDPLPSEWDAIHAQIASLTSALTAPEGDSAVGTEEVAEAPAADEATE